jgi:N-carbamoylputrescine amidase
MSAEGLIGIQRKIHASMDEYYSFRMGRHFALFDLGFCRVGVLICADANYFESWRVMAIKGADLLLLPHAGRSGHGIEIAADEQQQHLEKILTGLPGRYGYYAADNNVFAAYGNQVGYNGHSTHSGAAYVCGPDGKLIAHSEACLADLWIAAALDPAVLEAERNSLYSLLRTRRPETYQELTQ